MTKKFCGYISIVGKPNVGKSTLLNVILDKKVSITSRKSQTTRNNILGVKTEGDFQMVFLDTPGIHINATKTMNKVLNHSATSVIEDSDLVLFLVQRTALQEQDLQVINKIKESNVRSICVLNKVDQVENKNQLLPLIQKINDIYWPYSFNMVLHHVLLGKLARRVLLGKSVTYTYRSSFTATFSFSGF